MMNAPLTKPLTLTILGSGNVATHLSQAFTQAGHRVTTIYSRQINHANQLAKQLSAAQATDRLDFRQLPLSDLYLVCVTDAAVGEVISRAQFPAESFVAHTSGSLPLSVLSILPDNFTGVFYPIQTFSKDQTVDMSQISIAIEASGAEMLLKLENLGSSISQRVVCLSSEERRKLHLAAVFACNFTNHLLGISKELLLQQGLENDLLHPLIETTIQKALGNNPFRVQTGPAARGDQNILQSQAEQLQSEPVYQEIYRLLSRSIQEKSIGFAKE